MDLARREFDPSQVPPEWYDFCCFIYLLCIICSYGVAVKPCDYLIVTIINGYNI